MVAVDKVVTVDADDELALVDEVDKMVAVGTMDVVDKVITVDVDDELVVVDKVVVVDEDEVVAVVTVDAADELVAVNSVGYGRTGS